MLRDLVSGKEIMRDYGYSKSTFSRRVADCLVSPFQDAVVIDGRKYLIDKERWQEWVVSKSDEEKRKRFGI